MSYFKVFLSSLLAIASISLSANSMDPVSEDFSDSEDSRAEINYGDDNFPRSAPIRMISRDWDRDYCVMSSGCGGGDTPPDLYFMNLTPPNIHDFAIDLPRVDNLDFTPPYTPPYLNLAHLIPLGIPENFFTPEYRHWKEDSKRLFLKDSFRVHKSKEDVNAGCFPELPDDILKLILANLTPKELWGVGRTTCLRFAIMTGQANYCELMSRYHGRGNPIKGCTKGIYGISKGKYGLSIFQFPIPYFQVNKCKINIIDNCYPAIPDAVFKIIFGFLDSKDCSVLTLTCLRFADILGKSGDEFFPDFCEKKYGSKGSTEASLEFNSGYKSLFLEKPVSKFKYPIIVDKTQEEILGSCLPEFEDKILKLVLVELTPKERSVLGITCLRFALMTSSAMTRFELDHPSSDISTLLSDDD